MGRIQVFEFEIVGVSFPLRYPFSEYFSESVADQVAAQLWEYCWVLVEAQHGVVELPAEKLEHLDPVGRLKLDSESAEAWHVLRPQQLYTLRLEAQTTDHEIVLRNSLIELAWLAW